MNDPLRSVLNRCKDCQDKLEVELKLCENEKGLIFLSSESF